MNIHAIIYDKEFNNKVSIGDKVQIIPNHNCPVSNLYEKAYVVSHGDVVEEITVEGKGSYNNRFIYLAFRKLYREG